MTGFFFDSSLHPWQDDVLVAQPTFCSLSRVYPPLLLLLVVANGDNNLSGLQNGEHAVPAQLAACHVASWYDDAPVAQLSRRKRIVNLSAFESDHFILAAQNRGSRLVTYPAHDTAVLKAEDLAADLADAATYLAADAGTLFAENATDGPAKAAADVLGYITHHLSCLRIC